MEHNAAAASDDALDRFAGFGMFFERIVVHRLHHFKAFGLPAFFFGEGFVKVGRHEQSVLNGEAYRCRGGGASCERACGEKSIRHSIPPRGWLDSSVGRATD